MRERLLLLLAHRPLVDHQVVQGDAAVGADFTVGETTGLHLLDHEGTRDIQKMSGFNRGELTLGRHQHDRLVLAHSTEQLTEAHTGPISGQVGKTETLVRLRIWSERYFDTSAGEQDPVTISPQRLERLLDQLTATA